MPALNLLAIVDTETSSLSPSDGAMVQIGVALYSLEYNARVAGFDHVIRGPANAAESINGIPEALVQSDLARGRDSVMRTVLHILQSADAVLAHKASFDQQWLPELADKPWICTWQDVDWPNASGERSLVSLVLAHGMGVSHAHEAQTDVEMICRLLKRTAEMGHDVRVMLETAQRKVLYAVAEARFDEKRNALAKELGFGWDGDKKLWLKRMLPEAVGELPFAVREVA